ncbi:hypothetical protein A7D16_19350 [Xanthomonas nasturtii]|nr:hypothetical protein A7D16_19350 [Xanthomonas nasturtii]
MTCGYVVLVFMLILEMDSTLMISSRFGMILSLVKSNFQSELRLGCWITLILQWQMRFCRKFKFVQFLIHQSSQADVGRVKHRGFMNGFSQSRCQLAKIHSNPMTGSSAIYAALNTTVKTDR